MESNGQQFTQQPQGSPYPPFPHHPQTVYSGTAIASLVLGILSIIILYVGFILGIIAIVLGVRAYKKTHPYAPGNTRGMAIAGLVCGIIGTVLYGLILLLVVLALLTVP